MQRRTGMTLLAALVMLSPRLALAAPGDLDPTFGAGGIVVSSLGPDWDVPNALLLQDDGALVAVGATNYFRDFALLRYRADGSLDAGFGAGGIVRTDIAGYEDAALGAALDAEGRILAVGLARDASGGGRIAVARYRSDGGLDPSFGVGGKVVTVIGPRQDIAETVALQPDGRIVVAGYSADADGHTAMAVLRYRPSGELDDTFGSGGIVVTSIGTQDVIVRVVIQPDGKVVGIGTSVAENNGRRRIALVRYAPDGALDPTFGNQGIVLTAISPGPFADDFANGATLQPDGRIVVIGGSFTQGLYGAFVLARYRPDGSLDASFGNAGVRIDQLGVWAIGKSVLVQADGTILASGGVGETTWDFCLVRYRADGGRDAGFGDAGVVRTPIGSDSEFPYDLLVQPDGRIVATGYVASDVVDDFPNDEDFGLVRYEGDAQCGNQLLSAGEGCDDGNRDAGDGCSASCQVESCHDCAGTPSHCLAVAADVPCADDGRVCTADRCDGMGTCVHAAAPAPGCLRAGRSLLVIKDAAAAARDTVLWKWTRGAAMSRAALADPTDSAAYALCLYGADDALLAEAPLPAGAGWRVAGTSGYQFRGVSPGGLSAALLRGGGAGRSKALVKGSGPALPALVPPLAFPLTVQLRSDEPGACIESVFSGEDEIRNQPGIFKARR